MSTSPTDQAIQSLEIRKTEDIAAPIDVVFETILEQLGPYNETPEKPMPMVLEPWPGGRWFRDLGSNTGHHWAHVQSIKPPALLELTGPLFMSFPAISHMIYRLTEENGLTRVNFSHRAIGLIPPELTDGTAVNKGWTNMLDRIRKAAESRNHSLNGKR